MPLWWPKKILLLNLLRAYLAMNPVPVSIIDLKPIKMKNNCLGASIMLPWNFVVWDGIH